MPIWHLATWRFDCDGKPFYGRRFPFLGVRQDAELCCPGFPSPRPLVQLRPQGSTTTGTVPARGRVRRAAPGPVLDHSFGVSIGVKRIAIAHLLPHISLAATGDLRSTRAFSSRPWRRHASRSHLWPIHLACLTWEPWECQVVNPLAWPGPDMAPQEPLTRRGTGRACRAPEPGAVDGWLQGPRLKCLRVLPSGTGLDFSRPPLSALKGPWDLLYEGPGRASPEILITRLTAPCTSLVHHLTGRLVP